MVQPSKKDNGETIEMVRMRIICTDESAEVSYHDETGIENELKAKIKRNDACRRYNKYTGPRIER